MGSVYEWVMYLNLYVSCLYAPINRAWSSINKKGGLIDIHESLTHLNQNFMYILGMD